MKVNNRRHIIQKFKNEVFIQSGAEALAAALFSVLLSALTAGGISLQYYGIWPDYTQFVAGGTVYNGYNKTGDMSMFYLLLFCMPVYFVLFLWLKRYCVNRLAKEKRDKCSYVNQKTNCVNCDNYDDCDGCNKNYVNRHVLDFVSALLLGSFAITAIETAVAGRFVTHRTELAYLRVFLIVIYWMWMLALLIWAWAKQQNIHKLIEKISVCAQVLLPFCFLGYFGFYYQYENENGLIELFYSYKWKCFCVAVFVIFLFAQIYRLMKKKNDISVYALVSVATMSVMRTPEGLMSVDFFHNGEMALPMQQFVSYGKIPYFDIDPIHGLCDYVYSFFNYLFFDGSYFSQNAGIVVANLFIAAFLAVVLANCLKKRSGVVVIIWLFMPYLLEKAGIRYVFFIAAFFILLCDRVRKNNLWFFWWWILLCITGIFYNVSIGASVAVAFLPEAIYRLIKEIKKRWKQYAITHKWKDVFIDIPEKEKKILQSAWIVLVLVGICFIPWFMQILRFLHENAATTLWVNGTAIFGQEFRPVETFALFLPYLAVFVVALSGNKKAKSAFVAIAVGLFVIANYACVRYDEGLRLAVLGVVFCMICFSYFCMDYLSSKSKAVWLVLLCLACVFLIRDYLPLRMDALVYVEQIPAQKKIEINEAMIEDPVVYVSGDSVDMKHMGSGFIQGLTLNSLKNIQFILKQENAQDSFLDLTNKISHTVIFDLETDYPYTSAYNISNDRMQEKAIACIRKNRPRLILLAPYIRFDEATVSLRSPELYQAILQMGYQPYIYEDVIYLLDGESNCDMAEDGKRKMGLLNHRTDMGMLPYLWGTALEDEKENLHEVICENGAIPGCEVSYIDLEIASSDIVGDSFSLSFQSDVDGEKYQFLMKTGKEKLKKNQTVHYLIPVFSSPFFYYSNDMAVKIDGINPTKISYYVSDIK